MSPLFIDPTIDIAPVQNKIVAVENPFAKPFSFSPFLKFFSEFFLPELNFSSKNSPKFFNFKSISII